MSGVGPLRLVAGGAAAGLLVATALVLQFSSPPTGRVGPVASPSIEASQRPVTTPHPSDGLSGTGLAPGTYETGEFTQHLTYTVPEGWSKIADDPTTFSLRAVGSPFASTPTIDVAYDVYPPLVDDEGCQQEAVWDRPHGVRDLLEYWESRPDIKVRERNPIEIGGLGGWQVDLAALSWSCDDLGPESFIVRWHDASAFPHFVGAQALLIALDDGSGRTIVVSRYGFWEDPVHEREAERIIESFEFDPQKLNIPPE